MTIPRSNGNDRIDLRPICQSALIIELRLKQSPRYWLIKPRCASTSEWEESFRSRLQCGESGPLPHHTRLPLQTRLSRRGPPSASFLGGSPSPVFFLDALSASCCRRAVCLLLSTRCLPPVVDALSASCCRRSLCLLSSTPSLPLVNARSASWRRHPLCLLPLTSSLLPVVHILFTHCVTHCHFLFFLSVAWPAGRCRTMSSYDRRDDDSPPDSPPETPAAQVRAQKRQLRRSTRTLTRERLKLSRTEAHQKARIKTLAGRGDVAAARAEAAGLVRTRRTMASLSSAVTRLDGLASQLDAAAATAAMAGALASATAAMKSMDVGGSQLRGVLREYERESGRTALASEMMGEAVDDALAGEADAADADEMVDAVMDELGLEVAGGLADVPTARVGATSVAEAEEEVDPALQSRLEQLRR